ncbi:MAG: hypothetical protein JWN34_4049, partial [Bryobacterales bacterium]|nr:hypothetical protein [Bryobacterales bacterium]
MLRFALARIVTVVAGETVALYTVTACMLGLVLGGLLAYRLPVEAAACCTRLGTISLFTSCLGALSVMTATSHGIGLGTLPYSVLYVAAALPFIATGIVLAVAVAMGIERVGSVFAFGLL